MINTCLIGAGRMGRDHAKHISLSREGNLYAVFDLNVEQAETVAKKYGAKVFQNLDDLFSDKNVEAVVIASTTDTHADLIIRSAEEGKAIFCEKPIDLSIAKIDQSLAAVEKAKVPLLIGFNRRFDPSFQYFQQQLRNGAIGPLEQLSITSRDAELPSVEYLKRSGLLFRDMTIHDFDMARWLLNEEPVEVFATGSCLVDPSIAEFGDLDSAMIILKTESGTLCQISNSRRSVYGYDQRLEAFGPKGKLQARNLPITTVALATEEGILSDKYHPSFPQRHREGYQREMDHFFSEVIKDGQPPLISGIDSRQALVIAEAATRSYQEGRPVKIASPEQSEVAPEAFQSPVLSI